MDLKVYRRVNKKNGHVRTVELKTAAGSAATGRSSAVFTSKSEMPRWLASAFTSDLI